MSEVREEPIRWRRHRSWFHYGKFLVAALAVGLLIKWIAERT